MVLQKKKLKNGMEFHMTSEAKLLRLHKQIIDLIIQLNLEHKGDAVVNMKLHELGKALPPIAELLTILRKD